MRRAAKVLILSAAIAVAWTPTRAYADGFVTPWVGANFDNSLGDGRASFGVNAGGMGAGIIGGELGLGYSPNFFGSNNVFGTNNVLDLMANLMVGVPVGGQHGAGVRPYGTGGIGLIRSVVKGPGDIFDNRDNHFGYNLGGGVMGYFTDHVGLRGDVRYFRTIHKNNNVPELDLDLGTFHYWRASIGVLFR